MAVLTSSSPNLIDLAKSLDPSGKLARFANLLSQSNEMIPMMPYVKANNKTHHRVTQITSLPATGVRALNEGTVATKEEKAQHDEGIAMFDQWAVCDVDVAALTGEIAAYRAARVKLGSESMTQKVQQVTIYGNQQTNPKEFTGMQPRFNSLTGNIGQQVVDGGGSTADVQSSMWLISASPETVYYVYPDGSQAGLQHIDFGMQVEQNQGGVTGAQMASYKDQLKWNVGLVVEDQRHVVRIANLQASHFSGLTSTQAPTTFTNLLHKMMIASDRLPRGTSTDKFWCANRTIRTGLTRLAMEKSSNAIHVREAMNVFGRSVETLYVLGYPVLVVDQITNTEAVVA